MKDQQFWLGHDQAQYPTDLDLLSRGGLWIHAKNDLAAFALLDLYRSQQWLNFFWHENDARTLTSNGHWWTYPGQSLSDRSIAVMPEWHTKDLRSWAAEQTCAGICSDYVGTLKK